MVQSCSIINFGTVVKRFGSTSKKVSLGYVRLRVVMLQPWSFSTFGRVVKPFGSILKKFVLD